MIGRTITHYKILAKLGEGGMGTVYRGVDLMLDRPIALKVLHAHIARQPEIIARFRAEAALLARLNDVNVATLYSFFREGDEFFMVMELVEGENLASLMRSASRPSPERSLLLTTQVLSALHHAHRLEILHRDIKPANILVTTDGTAKITDFGIARALGSERLTRDTRLVGTLEYLAPERIKGEEGDFRSDLYSVGAVLYELLTQRLPFERASDFELMRAHLEERPMPLREALPHIPPTLEAIVLRALAKRPEDRFATAKEMLDALAGVSLHTEVPATRFVAPASVIPATKFLEPQAPVAVTPARKERKKTKTSFWLGLVGAAAVLFVLGLIFALTRQSAPPKPAPAPPPAAKMEPKMEPAAPPPTTPSTVIAPPAVPPAEVTAPPIPTEEEEAQEKRAAQARRRAAALKALEQ
jgi:serine/threonine-protein kinase